MASHRLQHEVQIWAYMFLHDLPLDLHCIKTTLQAPLLAFQSVCQVLACIFLLESTAYFPCPEFPSQRQHPANKRQCPSWAEQVTFFGSISEAFPCCVETLFHAFPITPILHTSVTSLITLMIITHFLRTSTNMSTMITETSSFLNPLCVWHEVWPW